MGIRSRPPDGGRASGAPGGGGSRAIRYRAVSRGIENVSMTTNGVLLPRMMAADLKAAGLSRVNISLDTLDRRPVPRRSRARGRAGGDARRYRCGSRGGAEPGEGERGGRAQPRTRTSWRSRSCPSIARCTCGSSSTCPWGRARGDARLRAGARTTSCPARSCSRSSTSARAPPGLRRARAGRRRPPARVGARALLRVPERAGHGGLHQPAVASLLQRMQPPAADGRRQAAPVPVLGRRVRRAHRAARRRRPGGARRVRRGLWARSPTSITTK